MNLVLDQSADPIDDLAACQAAIVSAGWWKALGEAPYWPLSTESVVRMLATAGEYAISSEAIHDLVERRLLKPPALEDGVFEWSASDVIALAGLLEARQAWKETPCPQHDAKKHPTQILLEECRRDNTINQIGNTPGCPRFDLQHLFILLALSDNREMRQKLISHTKAVLQTEHEVYIP